MLKPRDPRYKILETSAKPENIEYLKRIDCPHSVEACIRGSSYFENNTCPVV